MGLQRRLMIRGGSNGGRNQIPLSRQHKKMPWDGIVDRVTALDISKIFDEKHGLSLPRTVLVNEPLPDTAWVEHKKMGRLVGSKAAEGWEYASNQMRTSKYSTLTFLPRNLLEQFRRIANIFFLILVILQFIPKFQQVSPALACLPLLVVLGVTALKDGYEDIKRHQADHITNNQKILALSATGVFMNPNMCRPKKASLEVPGFGWLTPDRGKKAAKELKRQEEGLASEGGEVVNVDISKKKHWWSRKRQVVGKSAHGRGGVTATTGLTSAANGETKGSGVISEKCPRRDSPDPEREQDDASGAAFVPTAWEDIRVGDFVKLRDNGSVPADMVICATSDEENVCYIETKNLDGETNLKSRQAVPILAHLRTPGLCARAKFRVESEAPNSNMFRCIAAVVIPANEEEEEKKAPVDLNTMLLRGTVVRNTEWVIGLVVFTGRDTKIVMNSSATPSKRSKVEKQMNPMVFINLGLLAAMCVFNAIGSHFFDKYYYAHNSYWTVGENSSTDNVNINGAVAFANAMITYQNIVPISLYISIEFVRTVQAAFIWADDEIYYKPNNRRSMARSWNLSDDLGQIQYIFSDKTGTLTQNSMQFRQCSIGGKMYTGDALLGTVEEGEEGAGAGEDLSSPSSDEATRIGRTTGSKAANFSSIELARPNASGSSSTSSKVDEKKISNAPEVAESFRDQNLMQDLSEVNSSQARRLDWFFTTLALCHTVLASEDSSGVIQYRAQSPDEAALVQAAADVGFVFRGRDKNILRLQTPHESTVTEYELLEVIEFSSERKRMSVVVRKLSHDHAGAIFLLTKGADNIIFERLAEGQDELRKTTDNHLEEFANVGLRTLCLAYRRLDNAMYEVWAKKYQLASAKVEGRDVEMDKLPDELERELQLLGSTAIEDKLQDGVPEAIADLKRAGIKVWVATGDKLETAIAIARSCNLISRDMNVIVVKGGAYEEHNSTYSQLRKALIRFFDASELVDHVSELPPDQVAVVRSHRRTPSRTSRSLNQLDRVESGVTGLSDIVGDDNGQRSGGYGLVIDGASLQHALAEPFSKELLLELSTRCEAVVCCRTSPKQKAEIVHLILDGIGAISLAIGDGANDVSMIQTAHVGVGVAGEEGLQAVNSSDYAIGQFRYLVRLLTVHGHWSYVRNSSMIVNFFYKEIIGIAVLFFFQFWCGYSTTIVYEYTYLLLYNVIFTLLPVLAIGIFDQDIGQRVLMQVPELYALGRDGKLFGLGRFAYYMLDGIYQGAVCFFFIFWTYNTSSAREDGRDPGMYEMSTVMITGVVFAANLYHGLNTRSWTWWAFACIIVGPICVLLWTAIYSSIKPGWIWTYVYGDNQRLWPAAYWWLGNLLIIILSLLPRYFVKYYKEMYMPTDAEILRSVYKSDPDHDYKNDPQMPYLRDAAGYDENSRQRTVRPSMGGARPSFNRARTSMSITHDMASGQEVRPDRGFNFDQEDGMGELAVGGALRRYLSNQSNASVVQTRPRSRSIRIGNVELGFSSLSGRRSRPSSGSTLPKRQSVFGRIRSGSKGGKDSPRGSKLISPPFDTSPLRQESPSASKEAAPGNCAERSSPPAHPPLFESPQEG